MTGQRERLPNRRPAENREIEQQGQPFKPGSQSDCNARDAAVAASLALQYGCPLQVLQRALLRDSQGRPSTPLGTAIDAIAEEEERRR